MAPHLRTPETHASTPIHYAELMQLGLVRAPLTPEERQCHRLNNLCLYCGRAGHFLQGCPIMPSKWIEPPSVSPYAVKSLHLTLCLSLQIPGRIIQVAAIIDSGACSCFIDIHFSKRYGIPLCKKPQPFTVHLADGSIPTSGPITHETTLILATTEEDHQEYLRMDVISSPIFWLFWGYCSCDSTSHRLIDPLKLCLSAHPIAYSNVSHNEFDGSTPFHR